MANIIKIKKFNNVSDCEDWLLNVNRMKHFLNMENDDIYKIKVEGSVKRVKHFLHEINIIFVAGEIPLKCNEYEKNIITIQHTGEYSLYNYNILTCQSTSQQIKRVKKFINENDIKIGD